MAENAVTCSTLTAIGIGTERADQHIGLIESVTVGSGIALAWRPISAEIGGGTKTRQVRRRALRKTVAACSVSHLHEPYKRCGPVQPQQRRIVARKCWRKGARRK